ncbi:MAG: hypothetical protein IJU45_08280, partial [Clostridia bacterium]|nr:hypothetical protein [Clostridia bacterium]
MIYNARAFGGDTEIAIEPTGVRIGSRFTDYADVLSLTPMNHRVLINTEADGQIEISMLGFSYDGFWKELTDCFAKRSLEALFVEGSPLMYVEGEYQVPDEQGRAIIALYEDSVCILPQTCGAVRIPLAFTTDIKQEGYLIHFEMQTGEKYTVGKMGYDTMPFAQRAIQVADKVKKERKAVLGALKAQPPFTDVGMFRTTEPEKYWNAAFGNGCCAVELFTGEDAATFLYKFSEPRELFFSRLEQAMEAVSSHREILRLSEEQLLQNSLYRMTVRRC